eukprot:CAMPEP_0172383148 /NCGR_PEP_ID=MMETSP1061-20121228/1075_1 /TAXON_ID=37318 /ORGANISM="Pseudo-nitzschia pungens, Strain cf. pungens" /LENGTH=170 /DNA_ID=CAMNT_0013111299 /DNA_START=118 /DNA_END=630 /DNA_ORIENTATION=-
MRFSNLERYLFPDNVCSFGLCHVGSYDQNETDEEDVEEEVSPGAVEGAFHDDPPSPVAEPKRVRFDESEPVIEYYNDNVRTPKKRNHRNLKQRILQKSAEQQHRDRSNHNSNSYKEKCHHYHHHHHHHHSDGSASPVRRHIPSATSSSPLSRRSGRRRRKGNLVSAIFTP